MPITAGSISVARRINTGDYSHKEAKVEVHFTVEGDEVPDVTSHAAEFLAITRLASALTTEVKVNDPIEIELGAAAGEPEQRQKRHRRTKAEMEAARNPKAVVESLEDPSRTEPYTYPPTPAQDVASPAAPASIDAPATGEDWFTGPISDKALDTACGETMHRIKNKPAIQAVIQQYTDGRVSTIPQAQRTEFLSKLKAL